ncbi:hypothetical protein DENIS_0943 [Desulfonema ishimotonii]|uniref:DUF1573 domain-containing protein n=2 Tax=Desulfonema ishimotonii TaxID=45657 RepID=A0A401FSQ2_9BACT|nr:hypothetical protein DENIS_0943 [Desulfonema ishimotonii]
MKFPEIVTPGVLLSLLILATWTGCAPSSVSENPALRETAQPVLSRKAPPALYLPETGHEFEPVRAGTPVSHDFFVRNVGENVLYLRKISGG